MQEDLACVQAYTLFSSMRKSDVSDTNAMKKDSGHQAKRMLVLWPLTSQGQYKCDANLFWVNSLWSASPSILDEPVGDFEALLLLLGGSGVSPHGLGHSRQRPKLQASTLADRSA